jgi:hypothetical protein
MYFERRAYMVSLYSLKTLGTKLNFPPVLQSNKNLFLQHFRDSSYYYMWLFKDVSDKLDDAVIKISEGKRPYEDPVFDILDDLIAKIEITSES